MKFIPVIKAEFSASLLQCLVLHDPSEIIMICSLCWFVDKKAFNMINVWFFFYCLIFWGNHDYFHYSLSNKNEFDIEIF